MKTINTKAPFTACLTNTGVGRRVVIYDASQVATSLDDGNAQAAQLNMVPELLNFIEHWRDVIVGGDNPETLEGWAQDFNTHAARLLKRAVNHTS